MRVLTIAAGRPGVRPLEYAFENQPSPSADSASTWSTEVRPMFSTNTFTLSASRRRPAKTFIAKKCSDEAAEGWGSLSALSSGQAWT